MDTAFWRRLLIAIAIALVALTLSRLAFLLNSLTVYASVPMVELLEACLFGIRFDLVAVAYGLCPFLLIGMVSGGDWQIRQFRIGRALFLLSLTLMTLLNFIDAEFYKFTDRRSTSDLFEFVFISNDVWNILPKLIRDFWHLLIEWVLLSWLTIYAYDRFVASDADMRWLRKPAEWALRLMFVALIVLAMRGGTQRIPLMIQDAGTDADPHLALLILNTPFTVFKTLGKEKLPTPEFITQKDADALWQPIQALPRDSAFARLKGHNVVVIIMESVGCDYMRSQNGRAVGYTPFLDSLSAEGTFFREGFADGHRSIEGIPAVLSSTPTWMFDPFITSPFSVNAYQSLATATEEMGYATAFYHGGNNGTMGFDTYCRQAGFDRYVGRNEYPDASHYDGTWGIYDHHFLRFMARDLNKYANRPFMAGVFTLSSHHPYSVPEEYAERVTSGPLPIHRAISYADMALRDFFIEARKQPWFDNTLFVITSDHTSVSTDPRFKTSVGSLRVPILFYHPKIKVKADAGRVAQQTDIMPSVLHLLGYEGDLFAFGSSVFGAGDGDAVSFLSGAHQIIAGDRVLRFDGEKAVSLYDYRADTLLRDNLLHQEPERAAALEVRLKAWAYQYSVALNRNRMTPDKWNRP
jgi:phosphoglycerol transferase MdoB-like AlkP superfamily enzyme